MSIGHLGEIAADLIAGGRSPDTPTAVVQWAGAPYQKSILATLSTIAIGSRRPESHILR